MEVSSPPILLIMSCLTLTLALPESNNLSFFSIFCPSSLSLPYSTIPPHYTCTYKYVSIGIIHGTCFLFSTPDGSTAVSTSMRAHILPPLLLPLLLLLLVLLVLLLLLPIHVHTHTRMHMTPIRLQQPLLWLTAPRAIFADALSPSRPAPAPAPAPALGLLSQRGPWLLRRL